MAETQRLFQPDAAFDPETIQVLAAALDNAWETIEKSGSRFARSAYSRAYAGSNRQTHHRSGMERNKGSTAAR